nr:type II toxin-antitoxin system RelE/ParE family toxin [Salipiger sp. PrR002]
MPAARTDLVDVADFIALDNPERAMSFLAEIEAKMGQVAARPESFSVGVSKNSDGVGRAGLVRPVIQPDAFSWLTPLGTPLVP